MKKFFASREFGWAQIATGVCIATLAIANMLGTKPMNGGMLLVFALMAFGAIGQGIHKLCSR